MKKLLFVLFVLITGVASGQGVRNIKRIKIGENYFMVQDLTPISGYTRIFARYEWNSGAFDSTLYAPRYNGVPTGARVNENSDIDGKLAVDTVNNRLYFYSGGSWRYSTAGTGGGGWSLALNSITAGTDKIGTSNNARMNFYTNNVNTMTLDSLGARLYLLNGVDPLFSLKQATSNQEWQTRIGVGTGLASQVWNLYDATTARQLITANSNRVIVGKASSAYSQATLFVQSYSANGTNIDAQPDSAIYDEANIEAMKSDYSNGEGLGLRVWGNVGVAGTAMGYLKKNMGVLDFNNSHMNIIRVLSNRSLRFGTNNVERAVLDSNGRFGIGTTAPTATLYVNGQQDVRPVIINAHEDEVSDIMILNKANVHRFSFHSTGYIKMNDISAPSTPASGYGAVYVRADSLRFKNDGGTEFTMGTGGGVTGSGTTNYLPKWTGASALGNSVVYDDGTKVGMGNASPVSELQVTSARTSSNTDFQGTGTLIEVNNTAGVGSQANIGVKSESTSRLVLLTTNASNGGEYHFFADTGIPGFGIWGDPAGGASGKYRQAFLNDGSAWFGHSSTVGAVSGGDIVFMPDRNFGIGTISPSSKLHVISTTEQLRLGYDASNYYSTTVGSTGGVTFNAVGSGSAFNFSDRVSHAQGADVASVAGAISLGTDGNLFEITGTNSITLISNVGWQNGSEVTLMFTSTATLVNGTATSGTDVTMLLAGGANFSATANDVITLVYGEIGGTVAWREKSRSVN